MNNNNKTTNNNIPIKSINGANTHSQACAACKYQRKKCTPDCILAPYFPHNRQRQFLNAHKLFGVANITKVIKNLQQPHKDDAMRTIIFQSDVRANDPVGGCYRIICELHRQIELNRAELEIVLHQLAICRAQEAAAQNQASGLLLEPDNNDDSSSILNNCDVVNADNLCLYDDPIMNYHEDESYILQSDHDGARGIVPLQDQIDAWAIQDSGSGSLEVKQSSVNESCDNIKPTLLDDEAGGDGHKFKFEFEETNDRSFESLSLSLVS